MATLKDLIPRMAEVLDEPEKTVSVRAMGLRKAGLISSEGRGRSAEMTPRDAVNLFLANLAGGFSTHAADIVAHLRNSAPYSPYEMPPISRLADRSRNHALGTTLDIILDELVNNRQLRDETTGEPVELHLISIETTTLGYLTELKFLGMGERYWTLAYHIDRWRIKPKDEHWTAYLDNLQHLGLGGRRSTQSVNSAPFYAIACLLRGEEYSDQRVRALHRPLIERSLQFLRDTGVDLPELGEWE